MSNCVFLSTEIEVVQIGVFMASSHVAFLFPSMKSDSSLAKAWLVVWNMFYSIFHKIWDVILPIDELIFFKMVKTTNRFSDKQNVVTIDPGF